MKEPEVRVAAEDLSFEVLPESEYPVESPVSARVVEWLMDSIQRTNAERLQHCPHSELRCESMSHVKLSMYSFK